MHPGVRCGVRVTVSADVVVVGTGRHPHPHGAAVARGPQRRRRSAGHPFCGADLCGACSEEGDPGRSVTSVTTTSRRFRRRLRNSSHTKLPSMSNAMSITASPYVEAFVIPRCDEGASVAEREIRLCTCKTRRPGQMVA